MESALATAGVSTSSIAILYLLYKAFNTLKGHRLVSDCCGKKGEIGFDVRDMPPSPEETKSHPEVQHDAGGSKGTLSVRVPELVEHLAVIETSQGR